ncbi:MAG TPA: NAD(P)H-quinone oxidoreductase [Burkholderiales bacterium]|nr:NAD(P)H-quinone oxidoreductase [Burkholderiales bacterium]
MQVVEISRPGGPEVLKIAARPLPQPKPGEVLIRVASAGVNRPDCLQRAGTYAPPPGASDLPGLEVAGTIVKLGGGVTQWKEGDQVCALTPGGGYAQFCVTPAGHCLPLPKGWNLIEGASLPETFFTVWINVFERAHLAPGEILLVQGGSSGIGVAAIQLAHAFGHRVFVTAGSGEKCAACEALGAERAINYRSEDFVEVVKQLTGGKGADVILDMVGGDYVPRELKCLATDGRLSLIAFLGGNKTMLDMSDILVRRLTITGSTLRPRTVEFKTSVAHALRERVWPLIESGKVRPVIYKVLPLAEAAEAHALIESGVHVGKIMLDVQSAA